MDETDLYALTEKLFYAARVQRPALLDLSTLTFLFVAARIAGAVGVQKPERARRLE